MEWNFYISFKIEVNSSQTAIRQDDGISKQALLDRCGWFLGNLLLSLKSLRKCCCARLCRWFSISSHMLPCIEYLEDEFCQECSGINQNFAKSVAASCVFRIAWSKVSAAF